MTSVSNCDSKDIRPKSESLSCPVLFRETDLIRFKEENDLSTQDFETGITMGVGAQNDMGGHQNFSRKMIH